MCNPKGSRPFIEYLGRPILSISTKRNTRLKSEDLDFSVWLPTYWFCDLKLLA